MRYRTFSGTNFLNASSFVLSVRDEEILDQQRNVAVVFLGLMYSANLKLESQHCTM
jgi:hypothetical protein